MRCRQRGRSCGGQLASGRVVEWSRHRAKLSMQISNNSKGRPDCIARYYLRRLAMAHRESPSRRLSIQHINALVETILVFVGMPVVALASLILIPSLRWAPQIFPTWTSFSQLGFALMLWILSVIIGHIWLGRKLRKYRDDRSAYLEFNSARDARIASWQRTVVFFVCAIVLPLLAMYITFGSEVITKAFN
jgi:hypothetical protein